jgi:tetratricopeptide (TPR) repeat protein
MSDMSMEQPGLVYITKSAVHVIQAEARHQSEGGQFRHETGGILIGRRLGPEYAGALLIVAATRPGDHALHSAVEFNPDVDYVNRHLREYLAIYPKMDYIGIWHQHPPEFQTFSAGDVLSAHAICTDDDYRAQEVVNPIVWIRDNDFTIRYYYMNRQMATRQQPFVQIDGANVCLIDDNDPLIQEEKIRPSAALVGSQRVEEERQRLSDQGFTTQIGAEARYFYFKIQHSARPDLVIYAVTPPTYPKDVPVLAVEQSGRKVEFDEAVLWKTVRAKGDPYLADLVQALSAQIRVPSERITGRLMPTSDADTKSSTGRLALPNDAGEQQADVAAGRRWLASWPSRMTPLILGLLGFVVFIAVVAISQWWDSQDSPTLPIIVALVPTATSSATTKTAGLSLNASIVPLSELERAWQKVESASSLEQQVAEIEKLRQAGVERDPSGTPTAERLVAARMNYAAELAAGGAYDQAGNIVQNALTEAPPGSKQQASNQLADIYLAGGDSALERRDLGNATRFYEQVENIDPHPSARLLVQAAARLKETKQASDDRVILQQAWHDYESSSPKDKIALIEDKIVPITTWKPDAAKFPAPFYDSKTLEVTNLWLQNCLEYARSSQLSGALGTANEYFGKIQKSPDVQSNVRSEAITAIKNVDLARSYWHIVNGSSSTLEERIAALRKLQGLQGFGPQARQPINGPTVATLLVQLLAMPTSTPIPTIEPTAPVILLPTTEAPVEQQPSTPPAEQPIEPPPAEQPVAPTVPAPESTVEPVVAP